MKIGSMIAIYFVIWWTVLFVVLPFSVKNAAESGTKVEEGHDAGAPLRHNLLLKAAITTVLAAIVFAGVYYAIINGALGN